MANFRQALTHAIAEGSALCVGLDPSDSQLTKWGLETNLVGLKRFSEICFDSLIDAASIVKPQVGYFERFGPGGLAVLNELMQALRASGIFVLADAKRGDIGSTMSGYLKAWLTSDGFDADALTVHSYLGLETLSFGLSQARVDESKGLFALCATSNPEGAAIQGAQIHEVTVARFVLDEAERLSANEDHTIGVVIGATLDLESYGLAHIRERKVEIPILAPGYGAQGARLDDLQNQFGVSSTMVLPSMSRELLGDDQAGFKGRILKAREVLN